MAALDNLWQGYRFQGEYTWFHGQHALFYKNKQLKYAKSYDYDWYAGKS